MESSIAVFLMRQHAFERLPTDQECAVLDQDGPDKCKLACLGGSAAPAYCGADHPAQGQGARSGATLVEGCSGATFGA